MLGRTVPSEEIGEHLENVVSSSLSTDLDRQTLWLGATEGRLGASYRLLGREDRVDRCGVK